MDLFRRGCDAFVLVSINVGFCDTFRAAPKIGYPARLIVSKQHPFITVFLLDSSYEF
jgi:hypothetical protein